MRLAVLLSLIVFVWVGFVSNVSSDEKEKSEQSQNKKLAENDAATISAVLQHFSEQKVDWAFTGRESKKAIVINKESGGPDNIYLSDAQLKSDLSKEKWEITSEISDNLRHRNANAVPLSDLKFDKVVLVGDFKKVAPPGLGGKFAKEYDEAKAFADVWMPAYSKDGNTAVVRFWFGPTAHGAIATYRLEKKDGTWKVTNWKLAYYV